MVAAEIKDRAMFRGHLTASQPIDSLLYR